MALKKIYWEEELDNQYRLSATKRTLHQHVNLHWHDFYELELLLSGQGEHLYNGRKYPLVRGSLYAMSPADTHAYQIDESVCLYHLSVNAERLPADIRSRLWADRQPIVINEKDILRLSILFDLLIEECERQGPLAENTEKNLLEVITTLILRLMGDNGPALEKGHLHKAIAYMQTNFTRPLPLSETASVAGLNLTYFSELFTKKMGRSYGQYLTNLRIEYAKRLLRGSQLNVKEICFECGFSTLSTFLQAFRKTAGMTPSEYRKKHLS